MLKPFTIVACCFLFLLSTQAIETNNDIQKKILRSGEYDIECYVSLKDVSSFDEDKAYYWFKSGEIHTSRYGAGGFVLHKTYSKFYKSNQLAEKGEFNYGLKDGVWKTWYRNGQLKEIIKWNKGVKHGDFIAYNENGTELEKGNFKRNHKVGTWVNLQTKDTTVYKKGVLYIEDETSKESFFKRLFKKKDKNKDGTVKQEKDKKTPKKDGFFKRLFKKKDKTNTGKDKKNTTKNKTNTKTSNQKPKQQN